jgi:hypothetical protein
LSAPFHRGNGRSASDVHSGVLLTQTISSIASPADVSDPYNARTVRGGITMKKLLLVVFVAVVIGAIINGLTSKPAPPVQADVVSNPAQQAAIAAANKKAAEQQIADNKRAAEEKRQDAVAMLGVTELLKAMRDPESFSLGSELAMPDGSICYEYRARNGFGGMNKEYAVLTPKGKLSLNEPSSWNRFCANKTGRVIKGMGL